MLVLRLQRKTHATVGECDRRESRCGHKQYGRYSTAFNAVDETKEPEPISTLSVKIKAETTLTLIFRNGPEGRSGQISE